MVAIEGIFAVQSLMPDATQPVLDFSPTKITSNRDPCRQCSGVVTL